ncbi:hypothetical protein EV424DRAFT_1344418 [Suillus variegatus]|nr:hypothetical protein EV424DRAFT_1344418 [Suillus variegatus]
MFATDLDAQQISLCTYAVLAGNSILIYDHVLILPEEFTFIWRRPKGLAAMLFLLNRYLALLGIICSMVVELFQLFRMSFFLQALVSLWFLEYLLFCSTKTQLFEIYNIQTTGHLLPRNHHVYQHLLTWMTIIIIALVGVACVMQQYCHELAVMKYIQQRRIGLAWVAFFVFNLLIFVLTVYRICKTRGLPQLSMTTMRDIMDVIFQDGESFVASVLCDVFWSYGTDSYTKHPDILQLHSTYSLIQSSSVAVRGSLCNFTSCISVTLISRLMLNLHKTIHTGIFSTNVLDDDHRLDVLTTRLVLNLVSGCQAGSESYFQSFFEDSAV